jgi:hypothetical protein
MPSACDLQGETKRVPGAHDGGASFFRQETGHVHYVRNHERRDEVNLSVLAPTYDGGSKAGGGTTTVVFDPATGKHVRTYASLAGTRANCSGGPTPWGTFLSCEEDLSNPSTPPSTSRLKSHGWVFEVQAFGLGDPTGDGLLANIYTPGITLAIAGDWSRLGL